MRIIGNPTESGGPQILSYFRRDLGYSTDLPYIGIDELTSGYAPGGKYPDQVGERWNYATAPVSKEQLEAAVKAAEAEGGGPPRLGPPLPANEDAIRLNPDYRVMVATGMYDSYLQCEAGAETERTLPPQLKPVFRYKCYVGGHAIYNDAPTRTELARDVRTFVAETKR
jgi:hypothetical protein